MNNFNSKCSKRNSLEIKITKIGLVVVIIATFIFLFSNLISFAIDSSPTSYSCLIEKSDKETQQMTCFVKDHRDVRAGVFLTGIITAIIIIFGNIIVEYGHKNELALTTDTRDWSKSFRARGYQ